MYVRISKPLCCFKPRFGASVLPVATAITVNVTRASFVLERLQEIDMQMSVVVGDTEENCEMELGRTTGPDFHSGHSNLCTDILSYVLYQL